MKTKDSLDGYTNLIDSISFTDNPNVKRASSAVLIADIDFFGLFGGSPLCGEICGFDPKTGDVYVFLPLEDLEKIQNLDNYLKNIRNKFVKNKFEILLEAKVDGHTFFHVGRDSHLFILRSVVDS